MPLILAMALGSTTLVAWQFASTTEVVEVYATVSDEAGQPAIGLTAEAFTVLEDGVTQQVSVFTAGDVPLTVAIAVDCSFSMTASGLETARAGARRLMDQLRPSDRLRLLAIGGGVDNVAGFETPREVARQALDRVQLWGSSPIGDTIVDAVEALGQQRGRRAVVVWTDGLEREAQRTRGDVLEYVRRSDVLIYPVATARTVSPLLSQLAAASGGRVLKARDRQAAERAAGDIATELRHQYLLGYVPPAGASGWRRIEVRMHRPGLRVRARQGYFAPATAGKASPGGPPASNEKGVR